MRITYAEMQRRLASERNIANGVEFKSTDKVSPVGQRSGCSNTPQEVRDLAGALALVPGVKQQTIAAELGMSQAAVSQYKTGHIGGRPDHPQSKEMPEGKQANLDKIKDKALGRLMSSLGLLTDEKLEDCSPKDLSKIAVDMSRIHQSLSPQQATGDKVNLIVYSPQLRDESKFQVVEVDT